MQQILKNRFSEKVMIVTGGASGIGKAVALRAAEEGAKVVIVDMNARLGLEVQQAIASKGQDAIFIETDLNKEDDVIHVMKQTIDTYKTIDIMVNVAGISQKPAPLHNMDMDDFKRVFDINFNSVYFCCKHAITHFIEQDKPGVIVNTSSFAGLVGLPSEAAYVASKHAINGLTKNIALDYAKYNIRVNSVNPGSTSTPMEEQGHKYEREMLEQLKASGVDLTKVSYAGNKRQNLQQRNATAEEQAASILYLASDDSSHITGATMQTDGGWTTF